MTRGAGWIAVVLSFLCLFGSQASNLQAQPEAPAIVKDYANKVEPSVKPLLEAAFGPMKRKMVVSGSVNVARLFPGLNILLILQTDKALPEGPTIEARFKEIVSKLGGTVTRSTLGKGITKSGIQGGKVNLLYKGVTLGGHPITGQLIGQQGQTDLTFQVTLAR